MPFVPVPDTVQVNIKGTSGNGTTWENVYYVTHVDVGTLNQAGADAIASAWDTAYTSSGMLGLMSTGWAITETTVTGLENATDPSFSSLSANNVGTDSAQFIPGQSALVVSWKTALRGRSFRGRSYLNGWTEDQSTGSPSATAISTAGAFAGDLIAAVISTGGGDLRLAVVSRYSGTALVAGPGGQLLRRPVPRVTGLATDITSVTIADRWSTQRRRQFP